MQGHRGGSNGFIPLKQDWDTRKIVFRWKTRGYKLVLKSNRTQKEIHHIKPGLYIKKSDFNKTFILVIINSYKDTSYCVIWGKCSIRELLIFILSDF